jgi:hypothetical protein
MKWKVQTIDAVKGTFFEKNTRSFLGVCIFVAIIAVRFCGGYQGYVA